MYDYELTMHSACGVKDKGETLIIHYKLVVHAYIRSSRAGDLQLVTPSRSRLVPGRILYVVGLLWRRRPRLLALADLATLIFGVGLE